MYSAIYGLAGGRQLDVTNVSNNKIEFIFIIKNTLRIDFFYKCIFLLFNV